MPTHNQSLFRETINLQTSLKLAHDHAVGTFTRLQRMNLPERDQMILYKVEEICSDLRHALMLAADARQLEMALRKGDR